MAEQESALSEVTEHLEHLGEKVDHLKETVKEHIMKDKMYYNNNKEDTEMSDDNTALIASLLGGRNNDGMGAAGLGGGVGLIGGVLLGSLLNNRNGGLFGGNDNGAAALAAINNSSVMNLQGQNGINTTVERAASSTYTGLTAQNTQNLTASIQGFAGLNTQILQSASATQAAVAAADRGALERSFQAQLAAEKCCCETNLNIERQANETRALMRDQFAQAQAVLICDLKSQVNTSALENQFNTSQATQNAIFAHKISQVEQLINFKIPTPPTPPVF